MVCLLLMLPCLRNCPSSLGAVWNPASELKDLSSAGVNPLRSGHGSTSQKALQYKRAQTHSNYRYYIVRHYVLIGGKKRCLLCF